MRNKIVKKIGNISVVGYYGEPDDITKAIFKKGDRVSASDKCIHPFPSKVAVVDLPFLSLGEEELKYAVKGFRDDDGREWLGFYSENELKPYKTEGV